MSQLLLSNPLDAWAHFLWTAFALALVYAVAVLVVLQTSKDFGMRRHFNRGQFARAAPVAQGADRQACDQLIHLASANAPDALFGLTIEKIAGQIGLAATAVLENPKRYPEILRWLATGHADAPAQPSAAAAVPAALRADPSDVALLLGSDPAALRRTMEAPQRTPEQSDALQAYTDARTRVSHHIQRTIDRLQATATQRWGRRVQICSLALSLVLGILSCAAASAVVPPEQTRLPLFLTLLAVAGIGGLIAPVLRDFQARFTDS
jgi:hypothetical protein